MSESYQNGSVIRKHRQRGPDVWVFRYRRYNLQGKAEYASEKFSDTRECPTRAAAEKKAIALRKRVNDQRFYVTFGDIADLYEKEGLPENPHTKQGYLGNLKHLRDRWGAERVEKIIGNVMAVELWLNDLKRGDTDYSKQTRQHIRNLMYSIFKHAMKRGIITVQVNPIELVRVRGGRKKPRKLILSSQQIGAMLQDEKLPEHVKAIIQVATCTGMRISEILGLKWSDINYQKGHISILRRADGNHIGQTKSEESECENYPLSPILADALRQWRKAQEPIEDWIFGSAVTKRPFHARSLAKSYLRPAGKRAEIQGLGWHTFRHTYRAMLDELGEPLEVQQALMRHAHISTTLEYGKYSPGREKRLRDANNKVVNLVAG